MGATGGLPIICPISICPALAPAIRALSGIAFRLKINPAGRLTTHAAGLLTNAGSCSILVFDPVEDWVRFDWKSDEPSLIPAQGIPDFAVDRVNETIRLLELNTNIELQRGWYSVKRRLVDYLLNGELKRAGETNGYPVSAS